MHAIVAGGTGLIGQALIHHWLTKNYKITVIGRSRAKISNLFGNRVRAIERTELSTESFLDADVVVNLAGAGVADRRWTSSYKQEILDSRVGPTQRISTLLASLGQEAPPLFNASAVGIYGLQPQSPTGLPPRFDENTPIDWNAAPDFLSHVGREWEKTTRIASDKGVRVVNLRFGVVLTKEGGALPKIARPFYFFMGGPVGTGHQPFTWVSIMDLISAIDFLLEKKSISGPVNIVSPQSVMQADLAQAIGSVLHKPSRMRMPSFMFKTLLGSEMAQELLLEGQNVYPQRLLESGFKFSFPEITEALSYIFESKASS